jgi:hypothetical protein
LAKLLPTAELMDNDVDPIWLRQRTSDYMDRVAARPKLQEALEAEGLQ